MLGSQEKFLEPKVNVKFFTVDPYTPCNRVSRSFPIWQIWSLLGQKNMFFGGLVKRGNQIWIVFKLFLEILTQNSEKILVTLTGYRGKLRHFLKGFLITKPFKKCLSWPRLLSPGRGKWANSVLILLFLKFFVTKLFNFFKFPQLFWRYFVNEGPKNICFAQNLILFLQFFRSEKGFPVTKHVQLDLN